MDKLREALDEALAENSALRAANTKLTLAERDRIEAALAQPQNDAEAVETAVALAINEELCRQIDAGEEKDTLNVTSKIVALPIMQNLLRGTAPPPPERMREALNLYRGMSDKPVYSGPNVANIIETICALRAGDNHASDITDAQIEHAHELAEDRRCEWKDTRDGKESGLDTFAEMNQKLRDRLANPTPAQERREEIARAVRAACSNTFLNGYSDENIQRATDAILALPPAPKGEPSQEWNAAIEAAASDVERRNWPCVGDARRVAGNIRALRREPEGER